MLHLEFKSLLSLFINTLVNQFLLSLTSGQFSKLIDHRFLKLL